MSARSSAGNCLEGSTWAYEWCASSCPRPRIASVSRGNDSTVWPGTKNVAWIPCRSSRSSTRGTPTRAPYSPRFSIAGVVFSYPNQTESASKSNERQTVLRGTRRSYSRPPPGSVHSRGIGRDTSDACGLQRGAHLSRVSRTFRRPVGVDHRYEHCGRGTHDSRLPAHRLALPVRAHVLARVPSLRRRRGYFRP